MIYFNILYKFVKGTHMFISMQIDKKEHIHIMCGRKVEKIQAL